ncbi:MAG: hypothetical protein IJ462_01670 [Clostridia bacterium]|nr:hypothetical protein [Clostridia bacterium]
MKRLLSLILLAVILFSFSGCSTVSYDINKYNEILNTFTCLPAVDELGEYTDLNFKYLKRVEALFFFPETYTLRVRYGEKEFKNQKEFIDNNYKFQQSRSFETDFFTFRTLASDKYYCIDFPKQIVFIGISKTDNEIVYIAFYDTDLDYIEGTLQEFLEEECGWEE